MSSREERIGLNEAVFREVNERIENLAETFDLNTQALDLICECGYDSRRGGDVTSQFEYWAAHIEPRLAFRNHGIYGQRTDEIMARLEECVPGAHLLVVQGGINDIAQKQNVQDAADNLRAMVRRGKELGLRVAIVDV